MCQINAICKSKTFRKIRHHYYFRLQFIKPFEVNQKSLLNQRLKQHKVKFGENSLNHQKNTLKFLALFLEEVKEVFHSILKGDYL